jgi:integral membrane sensor domain MASE1
MSSRGVTTSLRTADIRITLRTGLELFAIGVAYFALAKLGLTLASINPSATPIWPPTGFAIAALLLWGMRAWPVIFIAALIANATTAGTVATSAAIAAGNMLEAVTIAWLVARWCGGAKTFDTPARVLAFATICGTTGTHSWSHRSSSCGLRRQDVETGAIPFRFTLAPSPSG